MDSRGAFDRDDELSRDSPISGIMQMSEYAWIITVVANLLGVGFIVMQVRVSLERRLSTLETLVKILMRDKGISIRSTDDNNTVDDIRRL